MATGMDRGVTDSQPERGIQERNTNKYTIHVLETKHPVGNMCDL